MKSPLHILHLEDDPNDASLIQSTLEDEGIRCAITRVENKVDFESALARGGLDLILSDYSLPAFDGISALKITHTMYPDLPVVLVSGTLGEERGVDALKSGATDYVMKEGLARLPSAVRRALQEVEERDERRRLAARFIEAQKMEVVGQLAGGVAHDFNNLLAVIMGYCYLSVQNLGPENAIRDYLEIIRTTAERAAGLTRQLLIFNRKQTVQLVVLDVNEVVHDTDKMLRRLIDENIEMTIVPDKALGRVKGDSGYIGQLVMNLAINARDAMPNGGKLTITTCNATLDEKYAQKHPDVKPGEYVMLSVCDTGTGMSEEVKAHLFEPFFTTKPKGKGTGLGLATCQTIVQQSSGHICVESEPGKGTTFKVYLPRVAQPCDANAKSPLNESFLRGTETLLLVEDEPAVRHLARRVLEAQGYEVISASNGQEALNMARGHEGSTIRLVVSDVIMPIMSGKVMAEWLKSANPDLKILFTSGYMDDAITRQGVFETGIEFLPKPYTPASLTRKVREMLDESSPQVVA